LQKLEALDIEVLATIGAGDIDTFVKPIKEMLNKKINDEVEVEHTERNKSSSSVVSYFIPDCFQRKQRWTVWCVRIL
jgi:hypothetical protein